ncbi:MAG: sulfatase [Armatimonadetes bacterium]|nr:sulfatase [Armatimonadota bacterium]
MALIGRSCDRRDFLGLLGSGTAALALSRGCRAQEADARARGPNVVLILADDLGYAGIGVQGCTDIPTPNIDSLAQNGARFTSGYVSCPVCSPTRAGLMTGRYQQRFGHEHNPGPPTEADAEFGLLPGETILPERLKALGYVTGMFGKWHLGYQEASTPTRRGFDEFYGFLGGAHSYIPGQSDPKNPILRGTETLDPPEYLTDALAQEAAAFIDRHATEPFFLYLPFNAVHNPPHATEKYLARFAGIADEKRRIHAAMLSALDDAVGVVLAKLRERGLEENTLVIFLSDNGGPTLQTTSSNLPLRGYKGDVYEGGIRVPFMVQWKGRVPAGQVIDQPVIALDLLPTVVAAVGGTVSPDWKLDGVNLLPLLTGETTAPPHDNLYWRFGEQCALRQGDWKLLKGRGAATWELYNLAEDIAEAHDLATQMPEQVAALIATWEAWSAELQEPRWKRQTPPRALGQGGRARNVGQQFKQWDANGDGKLTPDELPRENLFKRLDADGDGVVTPEEAQAGVRARQDG